jgi:1,2-diacylglycerol 3-beta-glucosyltransferase
VRALRLFARAVNVPLQAWLVPAWLYQLVVLVAAAAPRRRRPEAGGEPLRLTVLIPAHDEAATIGPTLTALLAAEYPAEQRRIVVVADNCTDDTAAVATRAGVEVWERHAPDARGKGQALAWAFDRLAREPGPAAEGVVLVDADCVVSSGLLADFDAALRAGADAVQADYVVSNADASPVAGLRFAAFKLFNSVRGRGLDRLGLSVGVFGTGIGFRADVLQAVPWTAFGVTEDREYHLRLVEAGRRVRFAPDSDVRSAMPTTHEQADAQQLRWEGGNAALAWHRVPGLLRMGVVRRDVHVLHAALALLVPPQALLTAMALASAVLAGVGRSRGGMQRAGGAFVAQGIYVVGGLAVARVPLRTYRHLPAAVVLVARKLGVLGRVAIGRGPSGWQRTQR